jgi:hypothetical protein
VAVLLPKGVRREVLLPEAVPMVQPGPLMALRRERAEAARPAVPAGSHPGLEMPARHPAHPSAAVARKARAQQQAVEPVAVRRQAVRQVVPRQVAPRQVALRLAEPAVQAVGAEPQQEVQLASAAQPQAAELGVSASAALQPEAAAVWDAAAGLQPAVGSVAAVRLPEEGAAVLDVAEAALPQAAVRAAAGAARRRAAQAEVLDAAGVRRRVARVGQAEAPAARLLAAAWAAAPWSRFRGDRPAPSARAQSAPARGRLRTAQP